MKAILFPDAHEIAVEIVDEPIPTPHEVVIKVAQSGICGTDIHIYNNEYMSEFPLTPGHEFSGEIVAIGKNVEMGLAVGDRVVVDPNLYCMACDFCRNEQANHCLHWEGVGITRPGGFAEYVSVPARACYRIPDAMTDEQAAFVEPLACVVYAMKRFPIAPAEKVLLIGAGPMGLLLTQALRHGNASSITVVEKQTARLELATTMGASHTVLAGDDQTTQLKEIAPYGFDAIIDATGVPKVIEGAFQYLKPRGRFLQFGVTPSNAQISINPYDIFHNDWSIIGSFALCYTFLPAIDWLAEGVIDVSQLVSHTVPMDNFADAFAQFRQGETLKVHVKMGT